MPIRITRSIVPNLFTLANLFSGFCAIVMFSKGEFENGAMFIFLAGIFDMFDGYMARLTNSASELGVELDSLCDAVSFGVAPSFLLYSVYYKNIGELGLLLAALPAMAGVYRLARFNAQLTSLEDKQYFRGMPIPSGALTIVSFVIFFLLKNIIPANYIDASVNFVNIVTSFAMISTIKYDNFPRPSINNFKLHPFVYSFFLIGFIVIVATKGTFVFPFMMLYMAIGAIRQTATWWKERNEIDEDEEDDDDEESD